MADILLSPEEYRALVEQSPILIWRANTSTECDYFNGGLLPICASCKNIRDDKGHWSSIEVYVRDHSEATFTHGICPVCAEKLYPGLVADQKRKDQQASAGRVHQR